MIAAESEQNPFPAPLDRVAWARRYPLPIWGMIHLPPLPGAPRYGGDPGEAERFAAANAERLVAAGYENVFLENFGDAPFRRGRVDAVTVAAMARCAASLRASFPALRLGINCLRNDAASALAIAASCEADAIRVNVHCGAAWSDQGLLRGTADRTLRLRRELGVGIRIFADLRVKHATPAGERPLLDEAQDLRERGLADAILITGARTGESARIEELQRLREALPDTPLVVASGVDEDNAARWAALADGAIVGSSLMQGGKPGGAIEIDRARMIRSRWRQAGENETESSTCA